MTNTPDDNTLAEKAAKFLGDSINDISCVFGNPQPTDSVYILFESIYSPYFMALGKRKMEKQKMSWAAEHFYCMSQKKYLYKTTVWYDDDNDLEKEHENEFISFWLAVRSAINGNENK